MFQQYEAELQEVLADAEARLGALLGATDTADRSGAVRQLNDLVRTARDLEKQIDVEVRSAAPDARAALRERARPLGDRLAALRRQAEAVAEEADRERVLGVRNPLNASAGARGRLAAADLSEELHEVRQAVARAAGVLCGNEMMRVDSRMAATSSNSFSR